MRNLFGFLLLVSIMQLGFSLHAAVAAQPAVSGWRGDGNGKYPDAKPPLDWGRVSKTVKELSVQARKPSGDAAPAAASLIPDGDIRHWLVLGPITIPDDKKPEELLSGIESLRPDENEKSGDLSWKAVTTETSCLDLCSVLNVPIDKKGVAALAHTYIYSPSGKAVVYNALSQGQGGLYVWLNGKQVFKIGDNVDMDFSGARPVLALQKGWNSLLILNAKTKSTRKTWWVQGSLFGQEGDAFDSHGIVWSTFTPAPGSSAPVIIGERLFFTAERGTVYCVNKADGKLLWIHSLSYNDFITDEERKANPEVMAELAPIVEHHKQLDQTDMAWKPPALEKDFRSSVEGVLYQATAKVSKTKYRDPARSWLSYDEGGMSVPTPVTDGKFVYVLFGTGIVVCFDPEGNRKWTRLLKTKQIEHGYGASPVLVDGKLVIYFDDLIVLDAKNGDVLVEHPRNAATRGDYFSTGCVLPAGNEKVFFVPTGEFVRLSDGKALTLGEKATFVGGGGVASSVVDNGVCYNINSPYGNVISFKLPALQDDKLTPEVIRTTKFSTEQLPYYYEPWFIASPLYHDGLFYCVGNNGNLTVLDMAKGEVVYQRLLDLDVFMPYNGRMLKGGASASPTLAGKYIYIWGNQGVCVVLEPGRTFKQVARLRIEETVPWLYQKRQEVTMSNPIFEGERMYYRAETHLYCIGPR